MVTAKPEHDAQTALASVEFCDDAVEYTLRCALALAPGFSAALAQLADQHVRSIFGESAESRRRAARERNAAIVRDYLCGERIGLLARRYELSERRILQIIKGR